MLVRQRGLFQWACTGAFKLRGVLVAPFVIYMLFHYDQRWERNILSWIAGMTLFFLGVVLRVAAQRHLRYRLSGERHLAMNGPYRFMRNPVYVANVLLLVGAGAGQPSFHSSRRSWPSGPACSISSSCAMRNGAWSSATAMNTEPTGKRFRGGCRAVSRFPGVSPDRSRLLASGVCRRMALSAAGARAHREGSR